MGLKNLQIKYLKEKNWIDKSSSMHTLPRSITIVSHKAEALLLIDRYNT